MYADWQMAEKVDQKDVLEEQVVEVLAKRGWTVTTAESCTGGLIAGTLVNVSGASEVLNEGYVTYSNEAKHRLLGVQIQTLEQYGAVSDQTAREMAEGAAKAAGADVAFASTGIAGPGGGTPEKPVGTVWIGVATPRKSYAKLFTFSFTRERNIAKAASKAMEMLLEEVRENEK